LAGDRAALAETWRDGQAARVTDASVTLPVRRIARASPDEQSRLYDEIKIAVIFQPFAAEQPTANPDAGTFQRPADRRRQVNE
jgi:hypothetical protein